ncbi:hypothetical protein LSH36_2307g00000, partial [Paralvinella palmiformis]
SKYKSIALLVESITAPLPGESSSVFTATNDTIGNGVSDGIFCIKKQLKTQADQVAALTFQVKDRLLMCNIRRTNVVDMKYTKVEIITDMTLITTTMLYSTVSNVNKYTNVPLVQLMIIISPYVEDQDIFLSYARPVYKINNEASRLYQKRVNENNINLIKMV